ncbi:hypothetical protein TNCV_1387331 [Trichonephila clavipes]|nr:hypothetical protein TNCV_1387331 [Trichonephila clavipes]
MGTALKDKTPSKLFVQFYSREDYNLIVKGTITYADEINEQAFLATADDILLFIGILLLTGYHSNTCECDYWSEADTLALPWRKMPCHETASKS